MLASSLSSALLLFDLGAERGLGRFPRFLFVVQYDESGTVRRFQ
jgi:hypothetical protein